jgi:hypothetical protein
MPRPTVPREDRPDIARKPEVKTLEWHIRKFAQQQKEWQSNHNGKDYEPVNQTHTTVPHTHPSTIPIDLNKPLPAHPASETKGNHDASRVLNPESIRRKHLTCTVQLPRGPESLSNRFLHDNHCSQSKQGASSFDLSKSPHRKAHNNDRRAVETKHTKQAKPTPGLPASLVAGRIVEEQPYRKQSRSEARDCGLLCVHLSVNDFRNTLPEELQPKEPPLWCESQPDLQIPVVYQKGSSLREDNELVQGKSEGASGVQSSDRELLPSASARKEGTDLLSRK